ncbi:MAG: GGDEF domain-containing phosphodiesterase [Lachnospiraceae bacterium]|nr:GGDEF domain-containing phosphodiesterase [Lachnospiraceae bacterium]
MEQAGKEQFYTLFEQMIDVMTDPDHFTRERLVSVLTKICELFGVAKGVTEFYLNENLERKGEGEILVDYDNGKGEVVAIRRRIVSRTGAVIIGTLYVPEGHLPEEEEKPKLDLLLRALLSFVSRNRLQGFVEKLGFYDEQEYPNFRSFMRFVSRQIVNGQITDGAAISMNLRHFSRINQEIGRDRGDEVMRSYITLLAMAAGENSIVCRIGGDNFIMMLPATMLDGVIEILRGVPIVYDETGEKRVMVSATAGVYRVREDAVPNDPGEIMEKIMMALQTARRRGEDPIAFYDERMQAMRDRFTRVQGLFPEALAAREFKVFYQPKVDVRNGRLVGAEALCRWFREGKIVPPMEFIPILEQGTDICRLDFYVLERVCEDINRWIAEGKDPVRVSVNLSRKHLADMSLLEHIMKIIEKSGVPHKYIEIELTETTTDVEFRDLKRVVSGLQGEGICTSVDDFGMGYSSLNLIREIPWNVLKIDRCFLPVDDDAAQGVTGTMYRHVISMARDLGLECVTEGVETIEHVRLLAENNCHIAQGFYFDRPLPVDEFEERLGRGHYDLK